MHSQPANSQNRNIGILFLHGFTGSPAELEWLQAQFDQLGFQTLLPTLCGHGTQPEAMLQCTYRDWLRDAENALNELRRQCKTVFVVGLSMGGALSLYLAAHHDFAGVVSMAAPVRL